jgi:hypothetical protein
MLRTEARGITLALTLAGAGVALTSVALQAALDNPAIAELLAQRTEAVFVSTVRVNLLTLFVLGALAMCVALWSRSVARPVPSGKAVIVLLALAMGSRMVAVLGFALYGIAQHGVPIVWDDEMAFHEGAVEIAHILQQGTGTLSSKYQHLAGHYLDLLGSLYATLGPNFLLARLLNLVFGVATVALTFDILRLQFDGRRALIGAGFVALWPTFVIWNGSGLRDTLAVLVALLIPWLFTRWPGRPIPARWIVLVVTGTLSILVLMALRYHAALAAIAAILVTLLLVPLPMRTLRARAVLLAGIVALAAGIFLFPFGGPGGGTQSFLTQFSPRALEYRTAVSLLGPMLEYDGDHVPRAPGPEYLEYGQLVRIVPPGGSTLVTAAVAGFQDEPRGYLVLTDWGATYFFAAEDVQPLSDVNVGWEAPMGRVIDGLRLLFVPVAPWRDAPLQHLLTGPDTLLFSGLWGLAVYGIWRERQRMSAPQIVLIVYLALLLLGLSLVSTNLGTVVRHRSMLIPPLVILATPAIASLLGRFGRRQAAAAPSTAAPNP